jgi:hypothetical protein
MSIKIKDIKDIKDITDKKVNPKFTRRIIERYMLSETKIEQEFFKRILEKINYPY